MLKSGLLVLTNIFAVRLVVSSPLTNNTNPDNVTILDFAPNHNKNISSDTNTNPADHLDLESWKETWYTHNHTITRVYLNTDSCVAIYFDEGVIRSVAEDKDRESLEAAAWFRNNPHWLFNFTSNVWTYMRKTYGDFGPDPYLHLVIHEGIHLNILYNYSIDPRTPEFTKYNILDITPANENAWKGKAELAIDDGMDLLLNKLANFVEVSSKNRFGSPSPTHHVWKLPCNETAWVDIFTFDVYTNLNLPSLAQRYKNMVTHGVESSTSRKLWFQEWFLPIYSLLGGNSVLDKYFQILSNNSPPQPGKSPVYYNRKFKLDNGDFIHFWSAAANTNLKPLAVKIFKWNDFYEEQFSNARKKYPYNYTKVFFVPEEYTSTVQNHETEHKALVGKSVAGTVIAVVLFILIPSLIYYRKKIKNLQTEIRALTNEEVTNFFEGDTNVNKNEAESLISSMPFIKDFEIPREKMIIDSTKVLGSGQYGIVIHGLLRDAENDQLVSVAMKTVKENVNVACFKTFLSEAKIMAYLGKHENIVDLLGTCTANIKNREIFLALEYCPLGNLENFLKENRNNFEVDYRHFDRNSFNELVLQFYSDSKTWSGFSPPNSNKIRTIDLLKWSQEISNAMMYLTVKKVIHGDLATRNILLTGNRVAKISDFGLSRQFLNYASYMKKSKQPVPWRWLAIECLKDMKFSTASDVWAFGVTMWEIFSLAEVPYGAYTYDLFFADKLISGDRLLVPTHANPTIYQIMKDCWEFDPKKRPTFNHIHYLLGEIISVPGKFVPVNYASNKK